MKSRLNLVAAGVALALCVASTVGSLNDFDDDSTDDLAADMIDASDVVTMAVPPVLASYAPAFGSALLRHPPARDTGRDVARRIFRPPI